MLLVEYDIDGPRLKSSISFLIPSICGFSSSNIFSHSVITKLEKALDLGEYNKIKIVISHAVVFFLFCSLSIILFAKMQRTYNSESTC